MSVPFVCVCVCVRVCLVGGLVLAVCSSGIVCGQMASVQGEQQCIMGAGFEREGQKESKSSHLIYLCLVFVGLLSFLCKVGRWTAVAVCVC